jgi:hypothetical protein
MVHWVILYSVISILDNINIGYGFVNPENIQGAGQ